MSKSKKKDKKKSKKDDKIELEEIDETSAAAEDAADSAEDAPVSSLLVLPGDASVSADILSLNQKPGCKVKVLPALDYLDDREYEEAASAVLNSPELDGYELLSVLASADAKKIIAFFRLSK